MGTGTTLLTLLSLMTAGQATPDDISHINEREFKIPITLPADPTARSEIEQLQLFVSKDEGKTWQKEAVATPRQESFSFAAPVDGTYWFNVSFTDRQRKTVPADISAVPPALKVVIDTRKPLVKLVSTERQGETIMVTWDVREDNPDLTTLKLEYRTGEAPAWRTVPVSVPSQNGMAKFNAATAAAVTVRLQISDIAGNTGAMQSEIPAETAGAVAGNAGPSAGTAGPVLTGTPGGGPAGPPAPPENPNWSKQPAGGPRMEAGRPSDGPRGLPPSAFAAIDERRSREAIATSQQPPTRALPPPVGPAAAPGAPAPTTTSLKRPVLYTNVPQIDLNYEVSRVGPSGVGQVTLYVTRDEGNTWEVFADDADLAPPFNVELPGEGLYGFTLVVKSKAGLGRSAPQSGQAPDIRVELDTTPPEAILYKVEADPRKKDMLFLTWEASDKNLADKPVAIHWSTKLDGPWQPIAGDLPNSGRYAWSMPGDLPFKVYLRLQVKDQAGNVATADTQDPVLVDLTEPEGRITGIISTPRKK